MSVTANGWTRAPVAEAGVSSPLSSVETIVAGGTSAPAILAGVDLTDLLAWVAIGTFVVAIVLEWRGRIDDARYVAAGASVIFGLFWLLMVPYYWTEVQSPLQSMLAAVALPLCLWAGYLLISGRDSLLVLVRAVAVMGLIYLPAETIPLFRQWLIEVTAYQTHLAMDLVATSPGLNEGANGYQSRFDFDPDETATGRTTYIILACTGLGSMAIFAGLIAAVRAPWRRKLLGIGAAVGIIWFLNLVRNVFIGLATPHGWFQQGPFVYVATEWMGSIPERTSFLISHNVISQPLSVIALVAIAYVVIRIVPEVLTPLEEVLFVVTGSEYDLERALSPGVETGTSTGD